MLKVVAPVPRLVHRPDCDRPGERLYLQNTPNPVQYRSSFDRDPGFQDENGQMKVHNKSAAIKHADSTLEEFTMMDTN